MRPAGGNAAVDASMENLSIATRASRPSPARIRSAIARAVVSALAVAAVAVSVLAAGANTAHAQGSATARDVYAFGSARFLGSTGSTQLAHPIVGMATTPHGLGYLLAASDGGIFTFGDAKFYGSTGALALNQPIVGVAATATGHGYWLVAADGGIFTFGDAKFYGSTGAIALNQPIVGMTTTASGHGYWLVAADGGIFTFGDARSGDPPAATMSHLDQPIVGMTTTATGHGYWLVAADGGIFTFGSAPYYGSAGSAGLSAPVAGMATTPSGAGYRLATRDGRVFDFGDAAHVTTAAGPPPGDIVAIASGADARGYWLASAEASSSVTPESAIAWYEARMGSTAFEGLCETAVENAFGTREVYATARADWDARPDQHADWQNAPRGSLVFYDTSSNGHVAISLGDGNVISTAANHRIGVVPIGYFQNPLGWARAPW